MKIQYWDVTSVVTGGCSGWESAAPTEGLIDNIECGGGEGPPCWVSFGFAGGHGVIHTNPCGGRMTLTKTGLNSYTLSW